MSNETSRCDWIVLGCLPADMTDLCREAGCLDRSPRSVLEILAKELDTSRSLVSEPAFAPRPEVALSEHHMGSILKTPTLHQAVTEPLEDLTFQPSEQHSLGVELELQVLDRENGDLTPGAVRILETCQEEGIDGLSAELMQSMIEVKTGVCGDVVEIRDTLYPLLRRVMHITNSLGFDLGMAGSHPFNRTSTSAVSPSDRYHRVQKRMAWLTYQIVVFGLHVHVGMPSGRTAIGVMNLLVPYLPYLLALSSNSPFWQGVDTGLASARTALFRLSPHAGMPPHFGSYDEFCSYCKVMHGCGAIRSTKDIHWDIRPRPQTGTLELRICDMPSSLDQVLGLTVLIRSLVEKAQRALEDQPEIGRGDVRHFWVGKENKWRATRYGLRAQCAERGRPFSLLDDLKRLFDEVHPLPQNDEERAFLERYLPLEEFESGADMQRRLYRESGKWDDVLDFLKHHWVHELEQSARSSSVRTQETAATRSTED